MLSPEEIRKHKETIANKFNLTQFGEKIPVVKYSDLKKSQLDEDGIDAFDENALNAFKVELRKAQTTGFSNNKRITSQDIQKSIDELKELVHIKVLMEDGQTKDFFVKGRTGTYKDNPENRLKKRVGKPYGKKKQGDVKGDGTKASENKETDSPSEIAKRMEKIETLAPFAPKVAKMEKVTKNDLHMMLPDYIDGGHIEGLFKEKQEVKDDQHKIDHAFHEKHNKIAESSSDSGLQHIMDILTAQRSQVQDPSLQKKIDAALEIYQGAQKKKAAESGKNDSFDEKEFTEKSKVETSKS